MIRLVMEQTYPALCRICQQVPLNGSLILTNYFCSRADWREATVWIGSTEEDRPQYALSRQGNHFRIAVPEQEADAIDLEEVAAFLRLQGEGEIQGSRALIQRLNALLCQEQYSSITMIRQLTQPDFPDEPGFCAIRPCESLFQLYDVVAAGYDYFREHVRREAWMTGLFAQRRIGCAWIYELIQDGKPICSGVLTAAPDSSSGVLGTIATLPAYRRQGAASTMVRFLCRKAAEMGKTAVLDCSEEALANFYNRLGFSVLEHWTVLEPLKPETIAGETGAKK